MDASQILAGGLAVSDEHLRDVMTRDDLGNMVDGTEHLCLMQAHALELAIVCDDAHDAGTQLRGLTDLADEVFGRGSGTDDEQLLLPGHVGKAALIEDARVEADSDHDHHTHEAADHHDGQGSETARDGQHSNGDE